MSGTTGTPVSGMTQVDYAPGLLIPAVDMTQPAPGKNVAIVLSNIVAAAQAAATPGGFVASTSADAVTAAGTSQATATALAAQDNVVTVCPVGAGVILTTAQVGSWITVLNQSPQELAVYPPVGAQWNALGMNVGALVVAGGVAEFKLFTTAQGYTR
ncbi:MAG: hypothetical protein M0002_08085 [Rhodospirillales bacterium]|nr:hypothetical protein [Rhodospirillales bacterium]